MAAEDLEARAMKAFMEYQYDLAVDLFSQAINLNPGIPDLARLLAYRGCANLELQNADADDDADAALAIDPRLAIANICKGDFLLKSEQQSYSASCFYLAALEGGAPDDLRPLLNLKLEICALQDFGLPENGFVGRDVLKSGRSRFSVSNRLRREKDILQSNREDFRIANCQEDWLRGSHRGVTIGMLQEMILHRDNYPLTPLESVEKLKGKLKLARESEDSVIVRLKRTSRSYGWRSRQLDLIDKKLAQWL